MKKKRPFKSGADPKVETKSFAFTWRERLLIVGLILAGFVVPAYWMHSRYISLQAKSIQKTVQEWQHLYNLNEIQVKYIQDIELQFHGSGSPFSGRPYRTPSDIDLHYQEIAELMTAENGQRFMQAMSGNNGHH
ncbi:hypothetical protein SAMN02745166_03475 [Prosthecobacter debontii]|uniref:Uncharacterized protein n=1 Tax=Prosthecobacter debontii TaxID=48467 RepID=A0A1T4YKP9_9BACT|nr:hypothetical protein [Prosthecobacter debontii]SKB01831.1 hypothetical protein SAMN02745166_03475 [Prosthecobacter debontii]